MIRAEFSRLTLMRVQGTSEKMCGIVKVGNVSDRQYASH